jgi:hypothetical protein
VINRANAPVEQMLFLSHYVIEIVWEEIGTEPFVLNTACVPVKQMLKLSDWYQNLCGKKHDKRL